MDSFGDGLHSRKRSSSFCESDYDGDLLHHNEGEEYRMAIDNDVKRAGVPLRKGKWTPDEEIYANRIIAHFNRGLLNIPPGSTLRCLLSEKLNCDPMRITKKFAGASCIGKQVFQPCDQNSPHVREAMKEAELELSRLEKVFIERLSYKGSTLSPRESEDRGIFTSPKKRPRFLGNDNGFSRPYSAPDLTCLSSACDDSWRAFSSRCDTSSLSAGDDRSPGGRGHQRSQSAINLDNYSADDHAAGYLLLQFFHQMQGEVSQSTEQLDATSTSTCTTEDQGIDDASLSPMTHSVVDSDVTVPKTWSQVIKDEGSSQSGKQTCSTIVSVGICITVPTDIKDGLNYSDDSVEVEKEREGAWSPPSF